MYKGVALSILASITFGVLYFYTQFLKPLDGEQTFAWRMLATLPFLTLFMWWIGDLKHITEIFKRIFKQPTYLVDHQLSIVYFAALAVFMGTDEWAWFRSLIRILFIALGDGADWLCDLQRKIVQMATCRSPICLHGRWT